MNINKCNIKNLKSKSTASNIIAFGVGAMVSSFCPTGLLFFIATIIIIILGLLLRF
ncbi:MAG: hypothetical protein J6M16_06155 [Clostridia bacterium]|nr:hypothetical protein [Clostridia bacterium]